MVDPGQYGFQMGPAVVATGLDCGMQPFSLAALQDHTREIRLQQRFTPGERHTAAGVGIECAVSQYFLHHLVDRHHGPGQLQRAGETAIDAFLAHDAVLTHVDVDPILENLRSVLTRRHASATADATIRVELGLGLEANPLGVVAPETVKGTPLQKDSRTDPRPIVDREPLYVEDNT